MLFSKSRSALPDSDEILDTIDHAMPATRRDRWAPVAYAGGMLAIGAGLLVAQPRIGRVPEPAQAGDLPRHKRLRRAAQVSRDGARAFAPSNVTDSIGRSLLVGGVALIMTRVLDEFAGHDGE
ncbi:hypothetical protein [Pararhodobacter marinus]|nr:hypothetical protein [Pararhodobacter marinus]